MTMSDQSAETIVLSLDDTSGTSSSSLRQNIFEHISTVSHTLVVGFVTFILFLCFSGEFTFFTWHPLLYTIGWTFLMLEAILTVSPDNILSKHLPSRFRVRYHWLIQLLAISFSTAAFFIAFISKIRSERPHFKSWHGLMGLISMCCCIPTCLNGFAALFNVELRKIMKPSINKLIHIVCGITTFTMGSTAMVLSLYSWWFDFRAGEASRKVCFFIIVFITLWCLVRPLVTSFNKIKSIVR